jgi:photosystem II stability/assembly factor-like uncharacterized protein
MYKKATVVAAALLAILSGCSNNNSSTNPTAPAAGNWTLVGSCVSGQLCASGQNLLISGLPGLAYISPDNGASWNHLTTFDSVGQVITMSGKGATLFAGTTAGIYRSLDNGISWSPVQPIIVYKFAFSTLNNKIFAASDSGFYVSSDNGNTWTVFTPNPPDNSFPHNGFCYGGYLYTTTDTGLYRTPETATSWQRIAQDLYFGYSNVVNVLTGYGTAVFAATAYGVFRSVDNGASWSSTSLSGRIYNLAVFGNTIFALAGSPISEVLYSKDNGSTWAQVAGGLEYNGRDIAINNGYLFCLGGTQIWRIDISGY